MFVVPRTILRTNFDTVTDHTQVLQPKNQAQQSTPIRKLGAKTKYLLRKEQFGVYVFVVLRSILPSNFDAVTYHTQGLQPKNQAQQLTPIRKLGAKANYLLRKEQFGV